MITQTELKDIATYDPETGIFQARVARGNIKVGDILGSVVKSGYVQISIDRVKYQAHNLARLYMTGEYGVLTDHIDRNPSNNRWDNLRSATQLENMWNRGVNKNSQTGIKGVHPHGDKFKVQFRAFGKKVYLGLFTTLEEAKVHHDDFVELFQGEFFCKTG